MPASPNLDFMTHPSAGLEGLTGVHAEVGTAPGSLHLDYAKNRGTWVRTEQTFANGWATSEEVFVAVDEPLQDLVSQVASWGGPVTALNVGGVEPHTILDALRPLLKEGTSIRVNGQMTAI
jgi:hypothetical protein